jgi:hypothetical protein
VVSKTLQGVSKVVLFLNLKDELLFLILVGLFEFDDFVLFLLLLHHFLLVGLVVLMNFLLLFLLLFRCTLHASVIQKPLC